MKKSTTFNILYHLSWIAVAAFIMFMLFGCTTTTTFNRTAAEMLEGCQPSKVEIGYKSQSIRANCIDDQEFWQDTY